VGIQRVEVTPGEQDIEPLHPFAIVELTLVDGFANGDGGSLVQRGKVADGAVSADRPIDDQIYIAQHFVDGVGIFKPFQGSRPGWTYWSRHIKTLTKAIAPAGPFLAIIGGKGRLDSQITQNSRVTIRSPLGIKHWQVDYR